MLLSVVIPTRNRARFLEDLLDSLARQVEVPFAWEVVIVDNGSTDDTAAVSDRKNNQLPITIRHVGEPEPGLHCARHRGAKEARGEIVSYIDDDMILETTWVLGAEPIAAGRADAVVGRIMPRWQAPPPDWLQALIGGGVYGYLGLLDLGTAPRPVDPLMVFGGGCFLPRKLLFELGGFHPDGVPPDRLRYRGDGETALMARFKQAGRLSLYDPRATAWHIIGPERLTAEYLCRRAYHQGVSDSFTQYRAAHGLSGVPPTTTRWERVRQMSPAELAQAVARKARRGVTGLIGRLTNSPVADVERRMAEAYQAGWRFHREQVNGDPALLEYVLKPTFLD